MPVSYFIDHEKKRLYTKATGSVTFIDLREHMRSEFGRTTAAYSELFDCTGATAELDADDMRSLVKERSQIAQVQDAAPVAIVAPAEKFYDLFKIFNSLTSSIRPIAVFRESFEAEQWLDRVSNTISNEPLD
jgi:hypothetical protein